MPSLKAVSRKNSKKVKPQKSKPRKSPIDRIVDREIGNWKGEFALRHKRADMLGEFFRQTVKLARELFKFNSELGYCPSELDQHMHCDEIQRAHRQLHDAAQTLRFARREFREQLRSEESNAKDIEKQIRAKEERSQSRENARKEVTKRLAAKA